MLNNNNIKLTDMIPRKNSCFLTYILLYINGLYYIYDLIMLVSSLEDLHYLINHRLISLLGTYVHSSVHYSLGHFLRDFRMSFGKINFKTIPYPSNSRRGINKLRPESNRVPDLYRGIYFAKYYGGGGGE